MEAVLWLPVVAPLLATVATLIAWRLKLPACPVIARLTCGLGLVAIGFHLIWLVGGVVSSLDLLATVGSSPADRQRLLSNCIAQAMYHGAFMLVTGVLPALVGWLLRGRRRPERTLSAE